MRRMKPRGAAAGGSTLSAIRSLLTAAESARRSGNTAIALGHYHYLLANLEDGPDPLRADVLRHIGTVHRELGETATAEDWYRQSLAEAERAGYRGGVAHATNWLAVIAVRRGELEEAERQFEDATQKASEVGDRRLHAMIEQNMGVLASIRGDHQDALLRYHAALRSCQQTGDAAMLAGVLNNIGVLSTELSRWDAAESSYREAMEIAAAAGLQARVNAVELNLAELDIKRRRFSEPAGAGAEAAQRARVRQGRWGEAEALRISGMAARTRGDLADAEQDLTRAAASAVHTEDRLLEAQIARELGETYDAGGRAAEARASFSHALELFRHIGARLDVVGMETRLAGMTLPQ